MDGRGSHGTSCLQTCFTPSKSLLKAHLSCQTLQRSRPDAGGQQGIRQTVHTFEKPIKLKECKRRAPARNKISERRDCWKQRSCGCKGLRCCSFDCERRLLLLTNDAARKHVSAPSADQTAITTSWHIRYRDYQNFQKMCPCVAFLVSWCVVNGFLSVSSPLDLAPGTVQGRHSAP